MIVGCLMTVGVLEQLIFEDFIGGTKSNDKPGRHDHVEALVSGESMSLVHVSYHDLRYCNLSTIGIW